MPGSPSTSRELLCPRRAPSSMVSMAARSRALPRTVGERSPAGAEAPAGFALLQQVEVGGVHAAVGQGHEQLVAPDRLRRLPVVDELVGGGVVAQARRTSGLRLERVRRVIIEAAARNALVADRGH